MSNPHFDDTLPGCYRNLAPCPGESLPGFLLRLSEANGYSSIGELLCVAKVATNSTLTYGQLFSLRSDENALQTLGRMATGDRSALLGWFARELTPASFLFAHCLVVRDVTLAPNAQLCPECLRTHGFAFDDWDFASVTVCSLHASVLLDACEHCGTAVTWRRPNLMHCPECGGDYRFMRAEPARTSECRVAEDFAALAPFRVQTFSAEPEIARWDVMNQVFKSLVLPREAWTNADWPDNFLARENVAVRHRATQQLADAFTGNLYDLRKLRTVAHQVLTPLEAIPRRHLLDRQAMLLLYSAAGMPREVAEPLCSHQPITAVISGAEVYAGRPPALRTRQELEEFLGSSSDTVEGLFRGGWLKEPLEEDVGFDIDMLLNAQRYLTTGLLSLSELAELAGAPLEWEDVELSQLVAPWNPLNPRDLRFDVSTLKAIQLRLIARTQPHADMAKPIGLGEAAGRTGRPGMFVLHATNMAQRGDLAFSWAEPYRWSSLEISHEDAERLICAVGPKTVR